MERLGFVYIDGLLKLEEAITNTMESFNSALRKVTDHEAAFPNKMAVMKILFLRTLDVLKKWTVPFLNWSVIRGKLDLLWCTLL